MTVILLNACRLKCTPSNWLTTTIKFHIQLPTWGVGWLNVIMMSLDIDFLVTVGRSGCHTNCNKQERCIVHATAIIHSVHLYYHITRFTLTLDAVFQNDVVVQERIRWYLAVHFNCIRDDVPLNAFEPGRLQMLILIVLYFSSNILFCTWSTVR